MPRPLKVFRTPTGFHDAYVATPSRAAALRAWGSDVDLFARGMAEEVTDEALIREPLAHPGTVVRVARGTAAEHLAALPATPAAKKTREPAAPRRRTPPPSKAALTEAQAAADAARAGFDEREHALAKREAALLTERRRLERDRSTELARLQRTVDEAEERYRTALADWEP